MLETRVLANRKTRVFANIVTRTIFVNEMVNAGS